MVQKIQSSLEKHTIADAVLRGLGQIMLQENRWTGLLFLIGLFINHWTFGLAALLACLSGTLIARLLKLDYSNIQAGLYGFSASLVGIALVFLFEANIFIWILIVLGAAAATLIQAFFISKKIPVYTFPFIIITWIWVFMVQHFNLAGTALPMASTIDFGAYDYLFTGTNGFGQVMFQEFVFSGILFFIGVLINDHIAALYALVASIIGAYIARYFGVPMEDIHAGLFGFNALLSAIVFSGIKKNDAVWVGLSVLITSFIHVICIKISAFEAVGGVFTFPFVLGVWFTIIIQKLTAFVQNRNRRK
ncbi:MAG: urea transporter [Chitinophagaceae bacterium]|nr:MAG: urea transporter [Chitinophagaceae bacterium]